MKRPPADVRRLAHETIYRTLGRRIETMDLPATYKAAVAVQIILDLERAGIGVQPIDSGPAPRGSG